MVTMSRASRPRAGIEIISSGTSKDIAGSQIRCFRNNSEYRGVEVDRSYDPPARTGVEEQVVTGYGRSRCKAAGDAGRGKQINMEGACQYDVLFFVKGEKTIGFEIIISHTVRLSRRVLQRQSQRFKYTAPDHGATSRRSTAEDGRVPRRGEEGKCERSGVSHSPNSRLHFSSGAQLLKACCSFPAV